MSAQSLDSDDTAYTQGSTPSVRTSPIIRPRDTRDRSSRQRRRRFALTYNNPTIADSIRINNILVLGNEAPDSANLSFIVLQTEKGESGTVHYQIYVEFKKAVSWSQLKRMFGDSVHIGVARMGSYPNIRYCTKVDTRFTGEAVCIHGQWGTCKGGGSNAQAAIDISNGSSFEAIDTKFPALTLLHPGKVESAIARAKGPRTEKPKIIILMGLTGCGKSQHCVRTYPGAYWVPTPSKSGVWWGHYMCQDVCVFDDFHSGWFTLTSLLRLLDSTPFLVAPKGDQVNFNSGTLVFTSNVDPQNWYLNYKGHSNHKDALERRIQDFATIYDCSKVVGPFGIRYLRTRRSAVFKFNKSQEFDFST